MIEHAVEELAPLVGTRLDCHALGVAPATIYRRRRRPVQRRSEPRPRAIPAPGSTGPAHRRLLANHSR
jgi:hypothetical protein